MVFLQVATVVCDYTENSGESVWIYNLGTCGCTWFAVITR